MVQAVVRIHSRQSLQRLRRVRVREKGKTVEKEAVLDVRGNPLPADVSASDDAKSNARDVMEYVVLSKWIKNSQEGPWALWGNAEPMTLDKLDKIEKEGK